MNRYLLNLVFSIVLMLVCVQAFSQVRLSDSGLTKFYDDGTRITYFEMDDFPNSVEMRDFVTKKVMEHPDVKRVVIYKDGKKFMYDALQAIEPDMIVDMVNDALSDYIAEMGDFPETEVYEAPKSKSPVKYTVVEDNSEQGARSFRITPVERPQKSSSQKSNDNINMK